MNKDTLDYQLYLVQREIIKKYNRELLKSYSLSYQHYLVLMVLDEHNVLPVLQLGERLAFQSGTITPIVKKMEANGLVERRRMSSDERVVEVILTEKAKKLIEPLKDIPLNMYMSSDLSVEEYQLLIKLSKKLSDNMTY
ncbi:MarR family winged helix-turn-helix transcriptional regulator [Macrococcoides caseolyticum]|uniref:HTH-type transcriptional regulator SarZ n=1 Tax=Macrococcus psychrotolerans TaxID=3039389 RepID=A0AAU6RN82_9STAP|nr:MULTISPECIES: MarR family transcriptional regulator [Macrococcus]MBQ5153233.1 MarR family transcriptional regulator [Macrococcus caseolyticus]MDJ1111178.1 MarR family transcriptional regulator [Macrococcus sp. S115]QYA33303.1 MarR family transcriptional regulator [Macrococcus sp. 19Msa1099]QYA38118.1 MarR family transcriptional regulator [Macrococcus caseolyticus]QYA76825.1 MarR family transcriptional regulator [Macrococcus caseolyticus]